MIKSKTLNTEILFQLLVKYYKPALICDVGTMDASHSVLLRKISKKSNIIAFEANPYNYNAIVDSGISKQYDIDVIHKAVTNKNGELTFNIQSYSANKVDDWKAGTSSILQRNESVGETESVTVDAIRLDQYLEQCDQKNSPSALWIDVEGAGYQVLEGLSGIADSVNFLQIEVETKEVWQGQKLKTDVQKLLTEFGFIEIGRGKHDEQHDLIFINTKVFETSQLKCSSIVNLSILFYYIRKYGGHMLSNFLLIPFLGIWRKD